MSRPDQQGFTLMELVVVLTLSSILAVIVSAFISAPMESYVTLSQPAILMDKADSALSLITRDVQQALPNSLRTRHIQFCDSNNNRINDGAETTAIDSGTVLSCASGSKKDYVVLEMIHVEEGVRYRARNCTGATTPALSGCSTLASNRHQLMLDITTVDDQFGIIGDFQYIDTSLNNYRLVIGHNPNDPLTNAYSNSGVITPLTTTVVFSDPPGTDANINQNLSAASFPGGNLKEQKVTLSSPFQFLIPTATHSPFQRLFVTKPRPARSYLCDPQTGEIFRYRNYAMNISMDARDTRGELDALMAGGAIRALVANDMWNCRIVYNTTAGSGATTRMGVVKISLIMTRRNLPAADRDQIRLFQQINVFNVD